MSISKLIFENKLSDARDLVDLHLEEATDEIVSQMDGTFEDIEYETLDEAGRKVVIKVNAKGQRRKKVVCGPGKRFDGTKCVTQSAGEKLARKKGLKKANRTKRAAGAGAQRRASKLRNKASKKRKSQGL